MSDCIIGYDTDADCVTMDWRAYPSSAAFRASNGRVEAELARRGVGKLLGEIEALSALSPDDQAWLAGEWIPRVALKGLRHVALVTPAFGLDHAPVLLVGEQVPPGLALAYFDDRDTARAWLKGRG